MLKSCLVPLACALLAAPLSAGLLDAPERLPGGTDVVVALDLAEGAIPRALAAMSFSAKASEGVLVEQLAGFAADTGVDLNAPISITIAGVRNKPDQSLVSGTLKIDAAKLLTILKPMAGAMKMELREVPGGLMLVDPRTGVLFKDGRFVAGLRTAVEAQLAGSATVAPDTKVVADELTTRAGANPAFALLIRTPQGLPGTPPPPAAVAGQQLAGFWTRFRGAFAACREKDLALELVFDGPDAAAAALPVVEGWLKIVEGQLGAAEAAAKSAAAEKGPFKNLDPQWVGARLSSENYRQMRNILAIKAEGPALSFSITRDAFGGGTNMLLGTAAVGVLAAIAVPNFTAARERANFRACFANQKVIAGAMEMYNLEKNTRRTEITPAFMKELVAAGYLQSVPTDPGRGEGTTVNYVSVTGSNGVSCTIHGSADGSKRGILTNPSSPGAPSSNPLDGALKSIFGK